MNDARPRRWPPLEIPLACGWLLGLICFSLPGREGPEGLASLDIVALIKVVVRLGTFIVLSLMLCACWRHPRRRMVVAALAPLGVYLAWAVCSASWSALKAVTLGQALGLIDLCLITAAIGLLWKGPADTSKIFCHLTCALLLFSAVVVVSDFISHDLSGLNRSEWSELEDASSGLVHPTTAGATASIGLVLVLGSWLHGGWRWPARLLVPGVAIHGILLVLAMSRMALVMAMVVGGLLLLLRSRPLALAAGALAAALLGLLVLVADPAGELTDGIVAQVSERLSRGESTEQLSSLTGRTDLWAAMWESYWDSPLKGHGYFVTSRTGEIDVWTGPANRTAHNALLQVLVSTGAIGVALFVIGLAWPLALVVRSFARAHQRRLPRRLEQRPSFPLETAILLLLIALWYAGWGQLSESFMGPVQPESIVFFSLLGIAIAHIDPALLPTRQRSARAAAAPVAAGGNA